MRCLGDEIARGREFLRLRPPLHLKHQKHYTQLGLAAPSHATVASAGSSGFGIVGGRTTTSGDTSRALKWRFKAGTRNCLYLLLIAIDLPLAGVGVRRQR